MKPTKITIVIKEERLSIDNVSCDDYRLDQMMGRTSVDAGEFFCRVGMGLPLGVYETTQVVVVEYLFRGQTYKKW